MEQNQREKDLKALRKIRDVLEEGKIGRALVLINREIQSKALPKKMAELLSAPDEQETTTGVMQARDIQHEVKEVGPYARTAAARIAAERAGQEDGNSE